MKKIGLLSLLSLLLLSLGGCSSIQTTPEEKISEIIQEKSLAKECSLTGTGTKINLECKDDPFTFLLTNFEEQTGQTLSQSDLDNELGEKMTYAGVGIQIQDTKKGVKVVDVYERNGLKIGDYILKVNGEKAKDVKITSNLIGGEPGKKIIFTIKRNGKMLEINSAIKEIKIEQYESKIVQYKGQQFGYLKLSNISEKIAEKVKPILNGYKAVGCKGVILDLRMNGGGYMGEAIDIVKNWTNKGDKILTTETLEYGVLTKENFVSDTNGGLKGFPTVILVDNNTASASEIITAGIKENNIWTTKIVGIKTYGKGTIQALENINDNIEVKYTMGKWYTPSGINLSNGLQPGNGLKPDVEVKYNSELYINKGIDSQIEKAKEILYNLIND